MPLKIQRLFWGLSSLVVLILMWSAYARSVGNALLMPPPSEVARTLGRLFGSAQTYTIIGMSFFRLVVAFTLATTLGVLLGLWAGVQTSLDAFLKPLVTTLRTVPVASVIVVVLILYGSRTALYVITLLMLFPVIYEATRQGVQNIDPSLKEAYRLESQRTLFAIVWFYLPLTYPFIKTGLLQSMGLGFKVLVMAEFIAQSPVSIGQALYRGRIELDYASVFAWTLLIIVIVYIFETLLQRLSS